MGSRDACHTGRVSDKPATPSFDAGPAEPFGPKMGWLAVQTNRRTNVLMGLGFANPRPVTWAQAVGELGELDRILVTPPLAGADGRPWVLAAGLDLELSGGGSGKAAELSAMFATEVQAFFTYRFSNSIAWSLARDGEVVRALTFAEGLVEWVGAPTEVELEIGLSAFAGITDLDGAEEREAELAELAELAEDAEGPGAAAYPLLALGEEDVLRVAAAWSVSPAQLSGEVAGVPVVADLGSYEPPGAI